MKNQYVSHRNSSVKIAYKLADGKRICLDVSIEVRDLLEQADRQIRSQRRLDRRRHMEYVDGLTDTTTSLPTEDFADQVIKRDSYQRLYAALERLPETQRRRVLLHFAAKLTYHQIAALEGVNRSTTGHSIKRALRQLRKQLGD